MTYHNTTRLFGKALITANVKARTQDEIVLSLFEDNAFLSPSMAHSIGFSDRTPLTSIRRSISTLTKKGLLVKTSIKRTGKYGQDEFCWALV